MKDYFLKIFKIEKLPLELPKAALNLYNFLDKIVLCAYLNFRETNFEQKLPKVI